MDCAESTKKMKVIILRTNRIDPDPRVEKEVNSLLSMKDVKVSALVWDRSQKYKLKVRSLPFTNGTIQVIQFGIPASWGGGMKANFKASIVFEWKLFWWLLLHQREYDCVHACDLLTGLPALLPVKLFRKKFVYDIFDYYADSAHGPKRILKILANLENKVINRADVTIICSEKRKEQIAEASPKKLIILHNAPSSCQLKNVNQQFQIQENVASSDRIKITYVGNLVEDRYIMQVLALVDKFPYAEFHIGGMGVLAKEIKKIAFEKNNVFFYGKMNYSDVLALEMRSDLLFAFYDPNVKNHRYAAPNKFYEALALGKPLIMFHHTGMDEVIEEYHIGAVCEATEEGIYQAIHKLIEEKEQWPEMSKKMKELFQNNYSWDIMEKRLVKAYRGLLESGNAY